jgi:hypothetical protein
MIKIGSRAELRCVTTEGHEAIYSPCEIIGMTPKVIEVKYCSKVNHDGNNMVPVFKRDLINNDRIIYLKELC